MRKLLVFWTRIWIQRAVAPRLLLVLAIVVACPAPGPRSTPGPEEGSWLFHGGGRKLERVTGVQLDHAGNVYVAGWFRERIQVGDHTRITRGKEDGFLLKLDQHGKLDWITTLGGVGSDRVRGLVVGPMGNLFLAGSFHKRLWLKMKKVTAPGRAMWVAKLSNQGAVVWLRSLGKDGLWFGGLGLSPEGEVMLAANFEGRVRLGRHQLTSASTDGPNVLLAGLDHQGGVRWVVPISSPDSVVAHGLAVNREGGAAVTGSFSSTVSMGSEQQHSQGGDDIFIAKVHVSGTPEWLTAYGGSENDLAHIICTDERRNITIAGTLRTKIRVDRYTITPAGPADIMVLRTDRQGVTSWATTLGVKQGYPTAMRADGQGNVMVAGLFSGSLNVGRRTMEAVGADDILLAELNGRGRITWTLTAGGVHTQMVRDHDRRGKAAWLGLRDRASGLAVTREGRLVIAGEFVRSMRFGSRALTARGYSDLFVWQLDRDHIGSVHPGEP